jgi:hypothetical protein
VVQGAAPAAVAVVLTVPHVQSVVGRLRAQWRKWTLPSLALFSLSSLPLVPVLAVLLILRPVASLPPPQVQAVQVVVGQVDDFRPWLVALQLSTRTSASGHAGEPRHPEDPCRRCWPKLRLKRRREHLHTHAEAGGPRGPLSPSSAWYLDRLDCLLEQHSSRGERLSTQHATVLRYQRPPFIPLPHPLRLPRTPSLSS